MEVVTGAPLAMTDDELDKSIYRVESYMRNASEELDKIKQEQERRAAASRYDGMSDTKPLKVW